MASEHAPDPILKLEPLIRQIVSSRITDADDVEDLVQETLTRLYEVRPRLELRTLGSYAIVTARNLVVSLERSRATPRRRAPELYEPRSPVNPEEQALRLEEHEALLRALARLGEDERIALVERDVLEVPTRSIARARSSTPGATATRIARSRARLRVEFLLAFRGVRPPTTRCRGVLYAVAAGDRTRQEDLGAGEHIEACAVCASLVDPLMQRSRSLAGAAPFAFAGDAARRIRARFRSNPVASSAVAVTAAVTVAAALLLRSPSPPPPPPPPPAVGETHLTIGGESVLPLPQAFVWRAHRGAVTIAKGAPVESVPSNEGFWVGSDSSDRIFVVIDAVGESRVTVEPSDSVWFRGRLVANDPEELRALGVDDEEGIDLLRQQGHHIVVKPNSVSTTGPT